jgi:PAS domain-containing protein
MHDQEKEQLPEVLRPELLRTVPGVARTAAIVPEPDGRIEWFNRACSRISGLEHAEVPGRSWTTGVVCGALSAQVST